MKRAWLISAFSFSAFQLFALDEQRLATAIYRAEGGPRANVPYGIHDGHPHTEPEARKICLATIRHAEADFRFQHVSFSAFQFVDFLGDRYCPPSADPTGNRNWKHNVKFFLAH
jgi:hypothetical protein